MADYWLNKLMFDLQDGDGRERWANRRAEVVDGYPLSPAVRRALLEDDYDVLQPLANPYLLRFFLLVAGHDDAGSIRILAAIGERQKEAADG